MIKNNNPEKQQTMPLKSPLIFNEIIQNSECTSIMVFDPSGTIEDVNSGLQKSLGYSRGSLIGKNFSVLFIEDDIRKNLPEKIIKAVMETGSSHNESYLKHEDGSQIWSYGECIYAKEENGQEHIVKIIKDLNREKILEQKLKEKNEEQEKIINDNETFIYTISHDLNSPVNNIEALLTSLEESQDDQKEVEFLVPLIRDSVERLRIKIRELSAIGKEQETEKNGNQVITFQEIFNEVLLDLAEEIESSGAEIFYDFSQAPAIGFSKKNLKSILQNLVSNSVKYRFADRSVKINVNTKKIGDGYILLNVQDNGLGIEEKDKDRIFDMYQRAHVHVEGTGVGLGIVKKIITDSGGRIELESKVGEGSKFKIYFKG